MVRTSPSKATRPRKLLSSAGGTLVFACALSAAAADNVQASAPGASAESHQNRALTHGRWSLNAGAGLMLSLSSVKELDGDQVSISEFGLGELALSALYQVGGPLRVGGRASWATELGQRGRESTSGESIDLDRSLSQVSLAARYQVTRGHSWALGGNVGAAAISDSVGDDSATQWAPVVASSVGYDSQLTSQLALGLELRASYAWFSESGRTLVTTGEAAPGTTTFRYGPTSWLGVHLSGHWSP